MIVETKRFVAKEDGETSGNKEPVPGGEVRREAAWKTALEKKQGAPWT